MTPSQRKTFEKKLLALRDELRAGTHDAKVEPNRTDVARTGGDEDEQPLNEMMQSIASGRNKAAAQRLLRVQRALHKLQATPERFGECETCEEPIADKRLAAMPDAELCVACQAARDGDRGPSTRRKLTDYR